MSFALHPHPLYPCAAIHRLEVDIQRTAAHWALRYSFFGDVSQLALPASDAPTRSDNLWQTTCCELFVQSDPPGYYEFNFSPSTAWAAYRFDSYRSTPAQLEIDVPSIGIARSEDRVDLHVQLTGMIEIGPSARLGITVVVEERSGAKSYWALAHAAEKPDFHRAETFIANINAK